MRAWDLICGWSRQFVFLVVLAATAPTQAHPTLDSRLVLDFHADMVSATLLMPYLDLVAAKPGLEKPASPPAVDLVDAELKSYISEHLRVITTDGSAWETHIQSWGIESAGSKELPPIVNVQVYFIPNRLPFTSFTVQADTITHEVNNHGILVLLRSDWQGGMTEQTPVLLGSLSHERRQITLTREPAEPLTAWISIVLRGIEHIFAGYDHVLFLALLLFAACLTQCDRQWVGVRQPKQAMRNAAWIITAFTVGHSATLVLGAVVSLSFTVRWVESLVALSIVFSALHLLRPLSNGKEPWIACIFGLVHGLAFAQALEVLHLATWDRAAALLGFNLGIELAQIALALVFVPLCYWVLQHPAQFKVRKFFASLSLATGLAWFTVRAFAITA